MPIPSFDDPRDFLDDFAVRVTVTPANGDGSSFDVTGLFDEKYQGVNLGDFQMQAAPRPRFKCMAVDVASLKKYDAAVVHDDDLKTSTDYFLEHDPAPDGYGYAILFLARDTDGV
jgi:hypothetical protein